ncbi:MAG: 50S ribosomal protein L17 [Thermodesulfovibrionales bacterium]|nr:50S ribosomal protein L17 [Thermodesulfovibrionales bacterium]
MRHKVDGRLFGRTANQRKALRRGLMVALFQHQRIETTVAKAKEIKKIAERVVTMGIRGDLHSKRLALSYVPNRAAISKLFSEIAPRFSGRPGGYLRIVHTRQRVNDRAQMAVLEFVDYEEVKEAGKEKPEQKEKQKPKKAEATKKQEKEEK